MKIQSKLIILVNVVILVTVGIFAFLLAQSRVQTVLEGVDQQLLTSARMIKSVLPHDYHDRIYDRLSVGDEEYRDIVDTYNQLCQDLGLQFLWSVMETPEGVRFTSSTTPLHDITRGGHALFFDIHSNPESFSTAFASMEISYAEFDNEWGHGRAVMIPYKDSSGRKYIFAASMSVDELDSIFKETVTESAAIGLGILLATMALVYFTGRPLARKLVTITDFANHIATDGPGDTLEMYGSTEVLSLVDSLNGMSKAMEKREDALVRERQRTYAFLSNAPAMIYMKDHRGRYVLVNDEMAEFFKLPAEAMIRQKDDFFLPSEYSQSIRDNDREVLTSGRPMEFEEEVVIGDVEYTLLSTKFAFQDEDRKHRWLCGISVDITARKVAEERMRLTRQTLETVSEGILITDADGVILDINPAFTKITGFKRNEAIGQKPSIGKSGHHDDSFYRDMWQELRSEGAWEGEIWDRRANGEIYPKWLSISSIRSETGEIQNFVGIFQDITLQKDSERELHQLAFYDPLTELPNRAFFQERLSHEIDIASRADVKLGVLFIDLDRFKYVNDSLGHSVGDKLLKEVGERLKNKVRKSDTVARLGGDEFAIIYLAVMRASDVQRLAQDVLKTISQPYRIDGRDIFLDASIGIVMYPDDAFVTEQLLRCADLAMYRAKEAGRGQFAFFQSEMTSASTKRLSMEADLRAAITNREFEAYYQPKIDTLTGKVGGMEALVRWKHPRKGIIPPDQFIPLAEDTGLIIPIGEYILESACRQTKMWHDHGMSCLRVAVNLSPVQFADPKLVETVAETLRRTGLPGSGLELEITESLIMKDVELAIETFERFATMGVHISIDDFGTGYSSLAYLKKFPIHSLKIDRSFIMDLETDKDDRAIVQSIGSMAENLELFIVAEGVETEFQLEFLQKIHCQYIQGYYFSKPLPAIEFAEYVHEQGVLDAPICQAELDLD